METAAAHFAIKGNQALEIFTFEENDLDSGVIPSLASLRPEGDPGLKVFDPGSRDRTEPLEEQEIKDALSWAQIEQDEIDRILNWRRKGIL